MRLVLLLGHREIPSPSIRLLPQIFVVMAVRHRLTVEWRRLGHVVTCGSRAVASNWGGKGGPTAAGQRIETLWQHFFSDPSRWLDCRSEKATARYPDFKHKTTQDSLWIWDRRTPPWVDAKPAAVAPGTVQWTGSREMRGLQGAVRLSNTRRLLRFSKKCKKKA